MAMMIGETMKLWKKIWSARIWEAAGCRSIPLSTGWPTMSVAKALVAAATPTAAAPARAVSREIPEMLKFMSLAA